MFTPKLMNDENVLAYEIKGQMFRNQSAKPMGYLPSFLYG